MKLLLDPGFSFCGFVGYKTPVVGLYYKYQLEKYHGYRSKSDTIYILLNVVSTFLVVIKDKHHIEYASGKGTAKNNITDDDAQNRFEFRNYFEIDRDGIKNFFASKVDLWDKTSAGTEK